MLSFVRNVLALTVVLCTTWVEGVALAAPAGVLAADEPSSAELRVDEIWRASDATPTLMFERWASACDVDSERVEQEREEESGKHSRDGLARVVPQGNWTVPQAARRLSFARVEQAPWRAPALRRSFARGPPCA
jgi:hypothetical protein